ncbi:uncharacterized protein [Rutidosis leptorrhynchoides]|uniref:uncharacterized protein n=1 Tax=Rutidosis leptorrhynchoides TaxID=125765 RepID=UPI003A99B2E6
MEGLHLCIKSKVDSGAISGVNVGRDNLNVSHLCYADDAIIISEWNKESLSNTLLALNEFYRYSGLKLNVSKSHLFGIGIVDEILDSYVSEFGCSKGKFPFSYLGLPIGDNMSLVCKWKGFEDRFIKKLSGWKANLLSVGVD